MYFVVLSPCVGEKDAACVNVCPVDCFYDANDRLVINPDECTCCGLCESECPVAAIMFRDDVPASEQPAIEFATSFFVGKSSEELEKLRQTAS